MVNKDEFAEVILLGTGGYGESILINRGENKWYIIDSCISPIEKKNLPLSYLEDRGVNVEENVELIICTHWHDDHIKGISDLLNISKKADFVFTQTTDQIKFLQLVYLDYRKLNVSVSNCSTTEFAKCLDIISSRNMKPKFAILDRLLKSTISSDNITTNLYSLSPSDQTLQNFNTEISQLINDYGDSNAKIIVSKPNTKSIALFLELGPHKVLLGSDLEVEINSPNEGWINILDSSEVIRGKKASLIKIPHHGSENGYHDRIWEELLEVNPVAKTTTYNKNKGLPTIEMISKYSSLSQKFYLTAPFHNPSMKKRDKSITKLLSFMKTKLEEMEYNYGIVKCVINMSDINATWDVTTEGNAFKVNS